MLFQKHILFVILLVYILCCRIDVEKVVGGAGEGGGTRPNSTLACPTDVFGVAGTGIYVLLCLFIIMN